MRRGTPIGMSLPKLSGAPKGMEGGRRAVLLVILQDAVSRAFQVVELARTQRPEKSAQTDQPKEQRNRNEPRKGAHGASLIVIARSRTAFTVTRIEDVDIANAAIKGVTRPAAATGTKIRL